MYHSLAMDIGNCLQELMEYSLYNRAIDWILQRGYQLAHVILAVAHYNVGSKLLLFHLQ